MSRTSGQQLLEIYIAESCIGCKRARELASQVREWGLPDVTVQVRDLGDPSIARPDKVFAVPTYLLDGRVISLGNPDDARLYALLRSDDEVST